MTGRSPSVLLFALLVMLTLPVSAQYSSPGSGITITENRRSQLETAVEAARWNMGPFRVQPWIGFRDLAYQENIQTPEGPVSDIHGAIGGGLRFYLPIGSDTIFAAHALPEYSFWMDLDDRNQVVGRYGVGLFAFLNRLELELTGRQLEEVTFLSSEVLRHLPQTQEILDAKTQLRITGALAIAVSGNVTSWDFDSFEDSTSTTDPGFLLDREESQLRAGLRYLLRADAGYFGIGYQDEETSFDLAHERDNDGTALYIEALVHGNNLDIALDIAERDLEGSEDGSFPGFSDTTGQIIVSFHPRTTKEWSLYARKNLSYSTIVAESVFTEQRYGLESRFQVGRRSDIKLFYEIGETDYLSTLLDTGPDQDVESWGAHLSFDTGRLNLRFGYEVSEYDFQNSPEFRQVEQILVGLSIGDVRADW